jgi:ring-1,2-phenylacetyl-CoA epoxidase subunit PaaE
MPKFHHLPVVNKIQETQDAISVSFQAPDAIKPEYEYKAGQYLTLKLTINGETIRRAYSLCSSPVTDDVLTVTVKRVEGGKMSNYLNDYLQIGQAIEVMVPEGRFCPDLGETYNKHLLLIAGGSGITPMLSILKTALQVAPASRISLVYANRNPESVIFYRELEKLRTQHNERLKVVYLADEASSDWQGITGRLDRAKMASLAADVEALSENTEIYLCGPGPMMEEVQAGLAMAGVPENKVQIEYFSSPTNSDTNVEVKAPAAEAPANGSKVFITLYGETHEVFIDDNKTILEAGVQAGIDPPFSCEAGICSTCMAKIIEGSAKMDENNILSQDEINQGYVLTCQAHPTAPIVRLEYFD